MPAELPPNSYVRLYGARYREAWRTVEALRSRRGKDGFPDWPDWCYVPAWYVERHIVAEGRASFPLERAFDPMILSALCAWRMGKGIYRFDPDLLQELWETPVAGEIPGAILLRLPEWCVYLELPGRALGKDMPIQGCFARSPFSDHKRPDNSWSGVISENHGITCRADDCERTPRQPLRRSN
jgi:hypothetical protein